MMTIKFDGHSAATVAFLENFVKKAFMDKDVSFDADTNSNNPDTERINNDISIVAAAMTIDTREFPTSTSNGFYSIFSDRENGEGSPLIYTVNLSIEEEVFIKISYRGIDPVKST